MTQKKYMSIIRLGHKSTVDILNIGDDIIIQEKIDGANASFSKGNLDIDVFSRRNKLSETLTLSGFYNFVKNSLKNNDLLEDYIYFGEWTAKHKVLYKGNQNKFFLFDIYNKKTEKYLDFSAVESEALRLNLNTVPVLFKGKYKDYAQLESYIGVTKLNGKVGDLSMGEGIVVKRVNYENKNGEQVFVKLVTEEFAEIKKQRIPKDPNAYKDSEEYLFAESVTTYARAEKNMYKMRNEGLYGEDIDKKDFGFIFKECNNRIWQDILKEESDYITGTMDTQILRRNISNINSKNTKKYLESIGAM